tara:strand:+ start:153185 stop:154228 length:1044 start_codon:yes stop_codon:yes gene_type:complete
MYNTSILKTYNFIIVKSSKELILSGNFLYILSIKQKFELTDSLICGRSQEVDLTLDDNLVSSKHFMIRLKNGFVYLKDLESHNGTFINGVKVESNKFIQIDSEDIIRVGKENLFLNSIPVDAGEISLPDVTGSITLKESGMEEQSVDQVTSEHQLDQLLLEGQNKTEGLAGLRKAKKVLEKLASEKENLSNQKNDKDKTKKEYDRTLGELKSIDKFLLSNNVKSLNDINEKISHLDKENEVIENEVLASLRKIKEIESHIKSLKKSSLINENKKNELNELFNLCTQRDKLVLFAGELDKSIHQVNEEEINIKIEALNTQILEWQEKLKEQKEEFGANFESPFGKKRK